MAIRVLVVDDSAFMRAAVVRLLRAEPDLEIVGQAADGEAALRAVEELHPDVVTLDVEMPRLDGLGCLRALMRQRPTRVVMLSSHTAAGATTTLDALHAGAIDFVAKPASTGELPTIGHELVAKVRSAATMRDLVFRGHVARALAAGGASRVPASLASRPAAPAPAPRAVTGPLAPARRLVAIASSTGGPSALAAVIPHLPASLGAGVVVVQHMPPGFTASLASRLAGQSHLPVVEAAEGDIIALDRVAIAPGGRHLVAASGGRWKLNDDPPVNGVRPSADITFASLAPRFGPQLLVVVLTGMGHDGQAGATAIRNAGGRVYAQDEASSVVWGMPGAVVGAGLAERVLPLADVAAAITAWCRGA